MPPLKHPPRAVPSSQVAAFVDPQRIDALLAPWVPDPEDRAFVVRCLLGEGPAHHRGANFVLLSLLGRVLDRAGGATGAPRRGVPVPLRLPPHLAHAVEHRAYPLAIPLEPLERLAPPHSRDLEAMVDCLSEGPPQHALANAAMMCLLGAILERLDEGE